MALKSTIHAIAGKYFLCQSNIIKWQSQRHCHQRSERASDQPTASTITNHTNTHFSRQALDLLVICHTHAYTYTYTYTYHPPALPRTWNLWQTIKIILIEYNVAKSKHLPNSLYIRLLWHSSLLAHATTHTCTHTCIYKCILYLFESGSGHWSVMKCPLNP